MLKYISRVTRSPSPCHRSTGPGTFLHTIYSRCVYDLGRLRPGQVLFFIDSFERTFGRAGTLSPVPIFRLPARKDGTNKRKGMDEENEVSTRARWKIKDSGNLIEIVPIIMHSGAAET